MKPKTGLAWLMMIINTIAAAQKTSTSAKKVRLNKIGIAFTNSHSAMPFGTFCKLFTGNYHPGVEISTGFDCKKKTNMIGYKPSALVIPITGGCSTVLCCILSWDTVTNFPQAFRLKQD